MPEGKTLYLMRHADASWPQSGQRDFDRPLSSLGKIHAQEMSGRLGERGIRADVILSSPAQRAIETLVLIRENIETPGSKVEFEESIYEADVSDLLKIIHALEDRYSSALIIGHNPALTWLINKITPVNIANAPAGTLASIHIATPRWKDFGLVDASLIDLDYPGKRSD
jgi:phosphohistidine phosphatase